MKNFFLKKKFLSLINQERSASIFLEAIFCLILTSLVLVLFGFFVQEFKIPPKSIFFASPLEGYQSIKEQKIFLITNQLSFEANQKVIETRGEYFILLEEIR